MAIKLWLAAGVVSAGLLGGIAVQASPVTYDWTSGTVTVLGVSSATGTVLGQGTLPLTSASQVTFDSAVPDVPSFEFADLGPSSVALSGAFAGDTLTVTGLNINSLDSAYSSSATGPNPYTITLNNLWASGSYSITNASHVTLSSGTFTDYLTPTLSGQINLSGGSNPMLTLNGIALDAATVGGQSVILKADVVFNGAPVPLPAAVWMFGSGLLALVGSVRRQRRTTQAVQ
jgi:hypothetical protein